MHTLRFRQVHLDFHTGGDIPAVGAKFDKAQFQAALTLGHVDSITLFSKCHHGWSYHPTKVGTPHPTLTRDLLGEQIAACREIGVRCPIYLSVGWDEVAALAHPDWVVVDENGSTGKPTEAGWKHMRFESGYLDYICAQIEEVVQRWPDNDGIFLDIVSPKRDYHPQTLRAMKAKGLDPKKLEDVDRHGQAVLAEYYRRTNAAVRSVRADTPVFHNGGHIPVGARSFNECNSHFELESLPTGGWGYDHFPLSARYAITQPRDFLGMTGKFHITWGEFGGFKRPEALRYECAAMNAQGAKCSVGDQLHPSGEMNVDTYAIIGAGYAEVEAREPWLRTVRPAARIAIISADTNQAAWRPSHEVAIGDEGVSRMLLELHQPFVVLDEQSAWMGHDLVILPDGYVMSAATVGKAKAFLAAGGKLIAAGSALLNDAGTAFLIDPGAKVTGRTATDPDYLVATALSPEIPVKSAILIKGGAVAVELTTGQELVARRDSYFNRTWDHFCGHQHAADAPHPASPAAVLGNGIAYFAHNLFTEYRKEGRALFRDAFEAALRRLLPAGLPVETNLPTVARFNLLDQPTEQRYVAHLLFAPVTLRATPFFWGKERTCEIIEDLIPLHNSVIDLAVAKRITKATLVPAGINLPFTQDGNRVTFTVPEFTAHQMVELSY